MSGTSLGGLLGMLAMLTAVSRSDPESTPEEWREGAPPPRRERAKAPERGPVNTTREQERRMRQMARDAAKRERGGR